MCANAGKLEVVTLEGEEDETCRTFVIKGEDHTLGNSLRYMIMKNPDVEFCGYSVPHPSEKKINIRIQTKGAPATVLLKKGLEDLNDLCDHVLSTFKKSVKQYRKAHQAEEKMEEGSD